MSIFSDWGFTRDSWRGKRGEYWVLAQAFLLTGFVLLPSWHPANWEGWPSLVGFGRQAIALLMAGFATVLFMKGLLNLGSNLTPLPYPRDNGSLVQTGVYGLVRHCLYSGLIFGTAAYSLWTLSLPHGVATVLLFIVLDLKARREEAWLLERFPEYADYRQRVSKFIPWIY
ncbi:MAG: isoprenylcysteine carboxylmethyltransferase family protein [Cyanobacteria bacterium P01_D01_bin.71]